MLPKAWGRSPVQAAAAASDIYAFTGHKWCFGPEGLGGVALSQRVLEQGPAHPDRLAQFAGRKQSRFLMQRIPFITTAVVLKWPPAACR
jgi:selenocysteine lyase/cysteine desulfurase